MCMALVWQGSGHVDQHELFEWLTGRQNALRRRVTGDAELVRSLHFVKAACAVQHIEPAYTLCAMAAVLMPRCWVLHPLWC
jgi:hypothetical protein